MSLSSNAIDKVAKLSKISIKADEHEKLEHELNDILNLVEQLSQADTQDVNPLAHPLDQTQPVRTDIITEDNQRDALQAIAPNVQDHLYIVPQTLEDA